MGSTSRVQRGDQQPSLSLLGLCHVFPYHATLHAHDQRGANKPAMEGPTDPGLMALPRVPDMGDLGSDPLLHTPAT